MESDESTLHPFLQLLIGIGIAGVLFVGGALMGLKTRGVGILAETAQPTVESSMTR